MNQTSKLLPTYSHGVSLNYDTKLNLIDRGVYMGTNCQRNN